MEITHVVKVDQDNNWNSFKIAPHVDQTAVYEEVYAYLNNNECVTIFPEGGSHDRSEMLPLKGNNSIFKRKYTKTCMV
jgi:glycerol-3-phosphate O-acyltransferase/dihydroxyacetone phosphate acyltransferase